MKKTLLTFCLFVSFLAYSQLRDDFSDGNFTENPVWSGSITNFVVNSGFELQSASTVASTSALFTPSVAIDNASWEVTVRINYATSSSNYACIYLAASAAMEVQKFHENPVDYSRDANLIASAPPAILPDISLLNGYFVMVGGTADDVSLYRQEGTVKTRLIDGTDKRTDGKIPEIRIRVTRDSLGVFNLYSKLTTETEYFFEGEVEDPDAPTTEWFGLSFTNTASTGSAYFFDDIVVTGNAMAEQPVLLPGAICFNELMVHAPDSSAEYIELYNRSDQKVKLGGKLFATRRSDGSISTGTVIPAGIELEAGAYIAFTSDSLRVRRYHEVGAEARLVQCKWTSLNNDEATLLLLESNRVGVIDSVFYSGRMHHVLIYDSKGVAFEKMHPDLPSSGWENWHSAASSHRYGTPGLRNSQFRDPGADSGELVWLEQSWFSPDNDGSNDRCVIRYSMPEPGYSLKVTILTPDGAPWYELTNGELLGTGGFLAWDGQNRDGRISVPGIYVMMAEVFHAERIVTKRYKMPLLLTIR